MDYTCLHDVPPFYLSNADTKGLLQIFDYAFELMHDDTKNFIDIIDYEKAEEKYLDMMIIESGWILRFDLDVPLKRKVVKMAQYMYSMKGTNPGIVYSIKQLMGIDVTIDEDVDPDGTFILGDMSLGETDKSTLGYGGIDFHFIVHTPTITSEEESVMTQIIDFMRWAVNTFEIVQDL